MLDEGKFLCSCSFVSFYFSGQAVAAALVVCKCELSGLGFSDFNYSQLVTVKQ